MTRPLGVIRPDCCEGDDAQVVDEVNLEVRVAAALLELEAQEATDDDHGPDPLGERLLERSGRRGPHAGRGRFAAPAEAG